MEKEFKTIAHIIENTNGQVVELNDGNYLYLSNEVITDIVRNNKYVYDNIFNEGAKTANSTIEATKKDAEGMYKRIKELESQFKDYVNYTDKLKDTINSKEATIAQYERDIECLNERIETLDKQLMDYVTNTDILNNIINSDKEAIDKYIRDANILNERIKELECGK